nr:type 1 glutamine amidotransferase [Acanthopleuribacter pedis]
MFIELLADSPDNWVLFDATAEEYPEDPSVFSAWVITGSASDAHADEPWIHRLKDFIRARFADGHKLLGFCFGHQAVAGALGGRSDRAVKGWEVGVIDIRLEPAFFELPLSEGFPPALSVLESHQDEVHELPPGALLLGTTPQSPNQIFMIGDQVFCMQGHPEYYAEIVEDLVRTRAKKGLIPRSQAAVALKTLAEIPPDRALWQRLLKRFLYR